MFDYNLYQGQAMSQALCFQSKNISYPKQDMPLYPNSVVTFLDSIIRTAKDGVLRPCELQLIILQLYL